MSQPQDVLRDKIRRAEEGGGPDRRERQHAEGKLTARERQALLEIYTAFVERRRARPHDATR